MENGFHLFSSAFSKGTRSLGLFPVLPTVSGTKNQCGHQDPPGAAQLCGFLPPPSALGQLQE